MTLNKRKIIASVLALTMIGASFSALTLGGCGCNSRKKAAKQSVSAIAGTKTFETDDILTACPSWLGMTAGSVGMSEEYITTDGGAQKIVIKGSIFGKPADEAHATFSSNSDVINRIFITTSQFTYDEAKAELVKLYGEPKKDEGDTCTFKASPNTVILSKNGNGAVLVTVY